MIRPPTRTLTMTVLATMLAIGSIAPAFAQQLDEPNNDDLKTLRAQRQKELREERMQAPQRGQTSPVPDRVVTRPQPDRNENAGPRTWQQAERRQVERTVESRSQLEQHREDRWRQQQEAIHDDARAGTEASQRAVAGQQHSRNERNADRGKHSRNAAGDRDDRSNGRYDGNRLDDDQRNNAHRNADRADSARDYRSYPSRDSSRYSSRNQLSHDQQRRLIDQQRNHAANWQRSEAARRSSIDQRSHELERQRRHSQSRYQRDYYRRWLAQQMRWNASRHDYYNDPYYYTASNYRYGYGGHWYSTNRYGANLLRQAVREGYQEGFNAGRADRQDRWRFDYRNSYAYTDGSYGYNGYYVSPSDYRYYFRQGFERGYRDGYYSRNQYGRYDSNNGLAIILPVILTAILGFQDY